jgi:tetratricopeptide (TPR) repeat protein
VGLAVAALAVYGQAASFEFVRLDDSIYVTRNPHVQGGLSLDGVAWAFTTFHTGNWHPLTWLSLMLDAEPGGIDARRAHLTNVALHVANAILLFWVLSRMTGRRWRSAAVAGLFTVHPVHVESVAWVSERKDVLSTLLWLLTMLAYLRYVERPGSLRYLLVVLLFAAGLLAKPMLVTLPFVLLLLDGWPLGRLPWGKGLTASLRSWASFWDKAPLLGLAAASCAVTLAAQAAGGAINVQPFGVRAANAVVSYVKYSGMMLWPSGLSALYPYEESLPVSWVASSGLLLLGVSLAVVLNALRRPYLLVGWLWYAGTLVPVIGLVQVGSQSLADRYTYVPLTGLFLMIVWGAAELLGLDREPARGRRALAAAAAAAVGVALGAAAHAQARHWRDSTALYSRALAVTERNVLAHNGLAAELHAKGRADEAERHFRQALAIEPRSTYALLHLAGILVEKGGLDEAVARYREALRLRPGDADAHANLAIALTRLDRLDDASLEFAQALRLAPDLPLAHQGLGLLLARQGKTERAIGHLRRALAVSPGDGVTRTNLGTLLLKQGDFEQAAAEFERALADDPGNLKAHQNLGLALLGLGRPREAIPHFAEVLRLDPNHESARRNLERATTLVETVR